MAEMIEEKLLKYKEELQGIASLQKDNEHSYRTPLENLLNELREETFRVIHEPSTEVGQGNIRPDFKVYKRIDSQTSLSYNALVGFVECKAWNENLDVHIKGKQIDKYLAVCPNILLTNYNRFILISFGRVLNDVVLFPMGIETNLFETEKIPILEFQKLLETFFASTQNIKSKAELIEVLVNQSFYLGLKARESYASSPRTTFHRFFEGTYETFKAITRYEFSQEEFCDILGQSVVYGLLVAHLESTPVPNSGQVQNDRSFLESVSIESVANLLPKEFLLLSEFIYFAIPSFHIPDSIAYALENIKKTIALIDKPTLATMLNTKIESIALYLYEDFLKGYDELRGSENRKEAGVFYTPEPVVNCIVSSLHSILKKDFGKPKGFGDKGVKALDFATGTGSFLAKVFELILKGEKEVFQNLSIREKFLKDIYGFELSFVPYIVAHIKLGSILRRAGFTDFGREHKLQVFLTNTLDLSQNADYHLTMPLFLLEDQDKEARRLKHARDILVIMGNPPYYQNSKNNHPDILYLHNTYKEGLNETNIQPLNNDYIKFMRFAQWKILEKTDPTLKEGEQAELPVFSGEIKYCGLMGFITPNSFIWGRTHRKMRQSLYEGFDRIYILNLHGDNEKDPKEDENVFDIRTGVCISIFIKYPEADSKRSKSVKYFSTLENRIFHRKDKFALLNDIAHNGLDSIEWEELDCSAPFYWFIKRDLRAEEYNDFWALAGDKALGDTQVVFAEFNSGIKSSNDDLAYHFTKQNLEGLLGDFVELDEKALIAKYQIDKPYKADWNIEKIKNQILEDEDRLEKIKRLTYRPFDTRYTYYSGKQGFLGRPRRSVMQHFLKENLGLSFEKVSYSMLIIDTISDGHLTGSNSYIAPLYCYQDTTNDDEKTHTIEKIPNFTSAFQEYCAKHKILKSKSPEQILYFIYANLYSPIYRAKYEEYLKFGFPRINFDIPPKSFEALESIGKRLVSLHLRREIPQDSEISLSFLEGVDKSKPDLCIQKLRAGERFKDGLIILNETMCIKGVSSAVYEYTIGGYKVIEKWLSARANRVCTQDELEDLEGICRILESTIELQNQLAKIKLSKS